MRFLATALLFTAACLQAQDPPAKKGPAHTNLKVLPDQNIGQVMNAFRVALGQQCTFCHVQATPPNFASDENPKKEVARMMITMVKDINAKFPDGKMHVTCYTCHRGKTTPDTAAPPPAPAQ
jgi:hypothetical protein